MASEDIGREYGLLLVFFGMVISLSLSLSLSGGGGPTNVSSSSSMVVCCCFCFNVSSGNFWDEDFLDAPNDMGKNVLRLGSMSVPPGNCSSSWSAVS